MRALAAAILLLAISPTPARSQDVREKYGTRSLEAATAFEEGMKLAQSRRFADALASLKKAAQLDPEFQMAYYWLGYAHESLGDIKQSLAAYEKLLEVSPPGRITNITVDGCFTAGLMLAKLEREEEAWTWFSRVPVLDPENRYKIHAKNYRNMSISLSKKGRALSAALTALLGYKADPAQVEQKLVIELLQEADQKNEEAAQLLYTPGRAPKPAPRTARHDVAPAAADRAIDDRIVRFVVDAPGKRVFAFGVNSDRFHALHHADALKTAPLKAPGTITASTVAAGRLFLALANPPRVVELDPATSAARQTWTLPSEPPFSLAVLAPDRVAVFPVRSVLHVLDLDTGELSKTDFSATVVESDPEQKNCYAFVRPDPRSESGHIIVDGRPIFFHVSDQTWLQTTLFRYAVSRRRLILAGVRLNAASNGQDLHVSADGQWVAVAGGGGWRPENPGPHKAGYRVAVLPTSDFQEVVGSFHVDAYPRAAAVNPVTRQVATLRERDLQVHNLAEPEASPLVLPGPFGGACQWTGDGRYLLAADPKAGVIAFRNTLSPDEDRTRDGWIKELQARVGKLGSAAPEAAAEAIKELASFKPSSARAEAIRMIGRAEKGGRTSKPPAWRSFPEYTKDAELSSFFAAVDAKLTTKDYGILIYQLQERLEKTPNHPGLRFFLGLSYCFTEQHDKAEPELLAAVNADRGRTDLSVQALRSLANSRAARGDHPAAAQCIAAALWVDLADPRIREEAARFFEKAGVATEGAALLKKAGGAAPSADAGLPPLPPSKPGRAMKATDLYQMAAASVVRVESGDLTGSGVCVGTGGLILTNAHVLVDGKREATVHPFVWEGRTLRRGRPVQAEVVSFDSARDLAVLRMAEAPAGMKPLAVAARELKAGEKVFAIGSPAMGGDLLEQSITEGIVSSPTRKVGGSVYVQHSAAVNPGNSGGPLLDEYGQVVGLVTLKARMENVSFAIPANVLRALFPAGK